MILYNTNLRKTVNLCQNSQNHNELGMQFIGRRRDNFNDIPYKSDANYSKDTSVIKLQEICHVLDNKKGVIREGGSRGRLIYVSQCDQSIILMPICCAQVTDISSAIFTMVYCAACHTNIWKMKQN